MVSSGVSEGILGMTCLLSKLPKDDPESNLRCSSPPVTPHLLGHVGNILLLTTIVRPTYSVY